MKPITYPTREEADKARQLYIDTCTDYLHHMDGNYLKPPYAAIKRAAELYPYAPVYRAREVTDPHTSSYLMRVDPSGTVQWNLASMPRRWTNTLPLYFAVTSARVDCWRDLMEFPYEEQMPDGTWKKSRGGKS